MISVLSGSLLLLFSLAVLTLYYLYSSIPAIELKRLARRGDSLAARLYRPAAYEKGLRLLCVVVACLSFAAGASLLLSGTTTVIGFAVLALACGIIFLWLPTIRLNHYNAWFAALFSAPIARILYHLQPILKRLSVSSSSRGRAHKVEGVYEKQDLLDMLHDQKRRDTNRIAHEDLDMAARTLVFRDKRAGDIVRPHDKSCMVDADENVGPLLLDQLHKSGQKLFPVYKDRRDNIIGSLSMEDAVNAEQGGKVSNLLKNDLLYVREDFNLHQVMAAFQKTSKRLAIVINKFEDYLGVITLEDIIKELTGELHDHFDDYENRRIVAEAQVLSSEESNGSRVVEDTSSESTEVIE
jgi:CBS domain containing-hemolysin-like protein